LNKFSSKFLPQNRDSPVSTGFAGSKFAKLSQKPSTKPIIATNSPQSRLIWPRFCEMN